MTYYHCSAHNYTNLAPGTSNPSGSPTAATVRPWVEVTFQHNGLIERVWCLLDTGADDTILDQSTAAKLLIPVYNLPTVTVTWGQGQSTLRLAQGLQLLFAGQQVVADVLFGKNIAMPLLGRSAWLAAGQAQPSQFEVGFDSQTWKHT